MVRLSFYPIGDSYFLVVVAAAALLALFALGPTRAAATRRRWVGWSRCLSVSRESDQQRGECAKTLPSLQICTSEYVGMNAAIISWPVFSSGVDWGPERYIKANLRLDS